MTIPFYKYQGTGNDFILLDQREQSYLTRQDTALIQQLCDRRFGIGADGLMFLAAKQGYDFEMVYFNADGSESTMCGNGGRCLTAFAHSLGVFEERCTFWAIDGAHEAVVKPAQNAAQMGETMWVELKMINVPSSDIEHGNGYYLMNTGSPHYVVFVEDLTDINIYENGRAIRYSERFAKEGVNVNFVEINRSGANDYAIEVATYERGVEAETFSCGTGVTAAAIAYHLQNGGVQQVPIKTKGGALAVKFSPPTEGGVFRDVWLCGAATRVFKGEVVK
jgi:diaminopimelate epimerase